MKRFLIILALTTVLLAACQQPSDIELQGDPRQSMLEVVSVKVPDTLVTLSPVDSCAILPDDQMNFWGRFVILRVTLDGGPGYASSFAYSNVLVSDSSIRTASRIMGFNGMDLGVVTLNGSLMVEVAHRIRIRTPFAPDTVLVRGVEYLADLSSNYVPNQLYTWTATSVQYGRIDVSVRSPDNLTVESPKGGSIHSRDRDLALQWTGANGKVTIIISAFDRFSRRSFPLLELRPRENTGRALIPASLLRQLPRRQDFVFTFILSNRRDASVVQSQGGRVLVQAASVYNSYIQLL
jgi:hypothetical protein